MKIRMLLLLVAALLSILNLAVAQKSDSSSSKIL
jgi:hypothetical protein